MYMEGTIENAPLAVTKSEQYVKLAKILPKQGRIMRAESRMPSLRKSSPSRGESCEPRAECQVCVNPPLAGEVSAKPTEG